MSTKILGEPGHYRPGADTNHFLGYCLECDAQYAKKATLSQMENWFNLGVISEAEWQGYTYVWSTSVVRFGDYGNWNRMPEDPVALLFVSLLQS